MEANPKTIELIARAVELKAQIAALEAELRRRQEGRQHRRDRQPQGLHGRGLAPCPGRR